jgi:hypothetical protein
MRSSGPLGRALEPCANLAIRHAMLDTLKQDWRELARQPPGHRFQNRFRRKQKAGARSRLFKLIAGIVLIVAGLVLLVIPGPGSVLLVIGAAFLAESSATAARLFDITEIRLREIFAALMKFWRKSSLLTRVLFIAVVLLILAAIAALAFYLLIHH